VRSARIWDASQRDRAVELPQGPRIFVEHPFEQPRAIVAAEGRTERHQLVERRAQ
jgi:hypothetical protein